MNMNDTQIPVARKNGLVIQEMPDEVLVYDLDSNKAHCLNETAAFVWKSCNGSNSVSDITNLLKGQSGSGVNEDLIWLAIDQLSEKQLLEASISADFKGQSRREVIKKIGLATVVALPLVASLTAPTSVMAAASCSCPIGNPAPCLAQACPNPNNCNGVGVCAP
jgi:hypothetical protein